MRILPLLGLGLLVACDPWANWPGQHEVFPWGPHTEPPLADYEQVRWEEGPWDPAQDPERNAMYLEKALFHRQGASDETVLHFGRMRAAMTPVVPGDTWLSFVGDVMYTTDDATDFSAVSELLDGSLRMGNLETPVAPGYDPLPGPTGVPGFNAPVELLDGLPLDVVQVNNNHSLDAGQDGLLETLAQLDQRGIAWTGADRHGVFESAAQGTRIAVLSYTWGLNDPSVPTELDLFVVPFGEPGQVDLDPIRRDIRLERDAGADLVVVLVHWGYEYEYYPDPHFLKLGRKLIKRGADLVVGHGPHTVQPAEVCQVNMPSVVPRQGTCSVRTEDGRPRVAAVLYSLGNFGTVQPTLPLQTGIVATVSVRPGYGVTGLGWEAVTTQSSLSGGVALVPLASKLDDPEYAAEQARLDAHLGVRWKRGP